MAQKAPVWKKILQKNNELYLHPDKDKVNGFVLFMNIHDGKLVFVARVLPNGRINLSRSRFIKHTLFLMPEWGLAYQELQGYLAVNEVMES